MERSIVGFRSERIERDPKHSGATIFSGKIRCGCCGGWYGSKVWHSNDKYRKRFLVVADDNPDAKRFYDRNGYQQVGIIPNLYRPGITEYLMAKSLKK